jgi:predicted 3-demethylubiquinone-9 3-methyltransferase (glyoxalase superfamily)
MASLAPCLWFEGNADAAAAHYLASFRAAGLPAESADEIRFGSGAAPVAVTLSLAGQRVICLNGPMAMPPSAAVSLFVTIDTQAEVDALWDALLAGGKPMRCGWLTDRYGFAWQVVPARLGEFLGHQDREAAGRAAQAMMSQVKLDIAAIEAAFNRAD